MSSLRSGCACRSTRRESATSTRASTSSAGVSSADAGEVEAANEAVYTYPSKKSLLAIMDKVRTLARHRRLADLLHRLSPMLRGWCTYFRHGVSSRTFQYLDHFVFWRVVGWIRKRHHGLNWGTIRRRFLPGWEIRDGSSTLYPPREMEITRYRFREARIDTPWANTA